MTKAFKVLKLYINILLYSNRLLVIDPSIFIVIFKRIFCFLFSLWWSFLLLYISLLHYLLIQSICQHIEFIHWCFFTKVLLEFKNWEINLFFFLFKISKIIDFIHIRIRDSIYKEIALLWEKGRLKVLKVLFTFSCNFSC